MTEEKIQMNTLQTIQSSPTALMDVISRAASDPNTDVTKLEKLLSMYERISAKDAEQQFAAAMTEAQAAMRSVSQDASNKQTKSRYASYQALDRALRPLYTGHGFALSFDTADAPDGYVRVVCKVSHRGGHNERPHLDMPADGKGAKGGDVMTLTHATMAAVTYGKRGLLKMIFNIAEGDDTDDDGNYGDGVDVIDGMQLQHLQDLITKSGADIQKLCAHFRVQSLPNLRVKDFDRAVEMLNKKMGLPK